MTDGGLRALHALGYNGREAAFLRTVALSGGVFLRRQFNESLGRECGALGEAFIQKLLRNRHAKSFHLFGRTVIYHVSARTIYAALGEPNNRNRRDHEVGTIKRRIMSLDFLLERHDAHFLLAAAERANALRSLGPDSGRCCTERHPVFLSSVGGSVAVAYVDEGMATLSAFRTFLWAHRELMFGHDALAICYVTAEGNKSDAAKYLFERVLTEMRDNRDGASDLAILLRHFRDRRSFENRDFSRFNQECLDRFRRERGRFRGEHYDNLFERWMREGDDALSVGSNVQGDPRAIFSAHVLKRNYRLFAAGFFQMEEKATCP